MATTTNYGWTTPDNTALVKDGAAAIRTLGSSIDTTLKAQIDAQIPDSLLTTKGDLIAATGANTPARLGVGSNDQVLTADSTAATGMKWAAPAASGAEPLLSLEASGYYIGRTLTTTASTVFITVARTYYIPIYLPAATYDRITMRSGEYAGASTIRMGLYNASATTGLPTTVIFDAGTVSLTAANTNYEVTISQTLNAGYYYLAINCQVKISGDGNYLAGGGMPVQSFFNRQFNSSFSGNVGWNHFYQESVTGAFATATSLVGASTNEVPIIGMRFA